MEIKENDSQEKGGFMQGWGFIVVMITVVIAVLVGIKLLIG